MKLIIILLSVLFSTAVIAQNINKEHKIEKVYKSGFRGIKSIENASGEVIGHYIFYRNGSNIRIDFLNTDVEEIASAELPYESFSEIKDAIFNGEHLLFTVGNKGSTFIADPSYNSVTRMYSFSVQGKKLASKTIRCRVNDGFDVSVYPDVLNRAFYIVVPTSSQSFKVQKVDSLLELQWEKLYESDLKIAQCEVAFPADDQLVLVAKNKKAAFSKKVETELIGLNSYNGDIQFVSPLYDGKYTTVPSQLFVDEDENIVIAGDYYKGTKQKSNKSKGIVVKKISPTGEDLLYNRQSWKKSVQKQLKKTKVKIGFKNKVLFHSLVKSANGGYQLIGETFSTSQVGGVIGHLDKGAGDVVGQIEGAELIGDIINLIAGAQRLKVFTTAIVTGRFIGYAHPQFSPGCLTIQDMVVFNFDSELNLLDVNKIAKPKYTKVYTYLPYNWYGGLRKAKTVADFGFFDFEFTQNSATDGQEVLVYNASYSAKPHIGVVNIEYGSLGESKEIFYKDLTGKKTAGKWGQAGCVPSVPGKMLIYYFDEGDSKKDDEQIGDLYYYLEDIY